MAAKDDIKMQKVSDFNGLRTPIHHNPERVFPALEESSELSVSCYRVDYSASSLARAVEDADAHLLNLNVTDEVLPTGEIVIDLRVSHRSAMAVIRSLERYGYNVVRVREDFDAADPVLSDRISQLLVQLNV